ncbi:MAG: hypothetical protein IPL33_20880 [Sphingobacteriales bacterium]|nr:hypothetical protein [Sphingobacteriales bacterium]
MFRIIAANARTAAVCPSRGRFARISPRATDAGYGRLCIVGGGFQLDTRQFHLLRSTKPSLCYFPLNLMCKGSLATKH